MTGPPAAGSRIEPLTFKIAADPEELEQIRRLNYRTFVEEIPQHAPNPDRMLVDRFDDENVYVICRRGDRVIGMIAVRGTRPFSLDAKLGDLDSYLPPNRTLCEIRLLAVEPEYRTGVVFRGLVAELMALCLRSGYDTVVISGTTRQLKLYTHLGFVPFGPLVGRSGALYQPMYLTREAFEPRARAFLRPQAVRNPAAIASDQGPVSFLPGPVAVHEDVWRAFVERPVSHRHPSFEADLRAAKAALVQLAGARRVEILLGSGSLANDVVAAQLSLIGLPGLVLVNGEFGERLADHARRAGLPHRVHRVAWGAEFDRAAVGEALDALPPGGWCWLTHCETSTGMINDLPGIVALCARRSLRVAADCISSLGTMPVRLDDVYLASGSSGKALGALPGLSFVFHRDAVAPSDRLPRYLDLGLYVELGGVPFTHSSNQVGALRVAMDHALRAGSFPGTAALSAWLRDALRSRGYRLVAPERAAAPGILTIALPPALVSDALGERLAASGFELSFRSAYLRRRNWIQIAVMGQCSRANLQRLLDTLDRDARQPQSLGHAPRDSQAPSARLAL